MPLFINRTALKESFTVPLQESDLVFVLISAYGHQQVHFSVLCFAFLFLLIF